MKTGLNTRLAYAIFSGLLSVAATACSGGDGDFPVDGETEGRVIENETAEGEIIDGVFHAFGEAYAMDELGSLSQALVATSCGGIPPSSGTLNVGPGQSQQVIVGPNYGIPSCPNLARVDLVHFDTKAQAFAAYDPFAALPTNQADCQKIEVSRVTMSNPNGTVLAARTRAFGAWSSSQGCLYPITGSNVTLAAGQQYEWVQALDQAGNKKRVRVSLIAFP